MVIVVRNTQVVLAHLLDCIIILVRVLSFELFLLKDIISSGSCALHRLIVVLFHFGIHVSDIVHVFNLFILGSGATVIIGIHVVNDLHLIVDVDDSTFLTGLGRASLKPVILERHFLDGRGC